jgi:tRNA A-37 threonylcarbamoyl transferase component Bud32
MAVRATPDILPPRYTSVETVAHGGMGEIYRACDESLGRQVAVKVLAQRYARDAPLRARFTREALAAARLSNESNTVTIYDVGEWQDRPYIVMELASGGTVAERLADGAHDTAESLRWLEQSAAALDAAHARGVVHRDVKPANLLLTREGDVRVADFGIASAAGLTSVTQTGTVLGTLGYLAPEQAMGRSVGPEADRYALAVVAYELLTGRRPFARENGAAEAAAAVREPVPAISQLAPGLPPTLDTVFERALAKEPAGRYPSCAEFVGDLRRAFDDADGATHAWAVPPTVAAPRESARWLPWLLAALLLAGVGIAAAVVLTRGGDPGGAAAPTRAPAVKTVTAKGDTITVTAPAPAAPAPVSSTEATSTSAATTTAPAASTSSASGVALNNAAWEKMKAGDYQGALPLLEQAVQKLSGSGGTAEAYALYNLAFTRFALGNCGGVAELLSTSESIQGHRSEIDRLRAQAEKGC